VADWLHRTVAGLAPGAPGYRRLVVRPEPARSLTSASARLRTPYGEAAAGWERAGGLLTLRVTVPVGATAVVHVPGESEAVEVGPGEHEWRVADAWGANGALPSAPTVRDVLDHEAMWQRVVDAARELSLVDGESEAAARLRAFLDEPAGVLVDALVPPGMTSDAHLLKQRLRGALESQVGGLAPLSGGGGLL
jgi:alpha-L-rhamnosidase